MSTNNQEIYQPREGLVNNPGTDNSQPTSPIDQFRQLFYGRPEQTQFTSLVVPRQNNDQNSDAAPVPPPGPRPGDVPPAPVNPNPQGEAPQGDAAPNPVGPPAPQGDGPPAPAAPAQPGQAREVAADRRVPDDWRLQQLQQELAQLPQQLSADVQRWVTQLGSGNAQERSAAIAGLRANPEAGRLAFRAALEQPNHAVHGLIGQMVSGEATVQANAMAALRPFSDLVTMQMGNLLKNQPNSDFVTGLNRLVGDLASANPQDRNTHARHLEAARALESLRSIAPGVVDQAIESQLRDPNSAMSRSVNNLITSLGSDNWRVRDFATHALSNFGGPIMPILQRNLPNPNLEASRRIEQLMARIPEQQTNRVVEAMMQAGRDALPRTGNAEQDQALERQFRTLLDGVFRGNPETMVSALGNYREFINQWGKFERSFEPNSPAQWNAMATALQRAFDSDARTRGLIARVTPQGNFIVGQDQNEGPPGSSLVLVERNQRSNFPLSFRTVPLPPQRPDANPFMVMPPPPQTAQEAMRDVFVDPFGQGMVQLHRTEVTLPVPQGLGGLVIPPTVQIPHWGPYESRRQQWQQQQYGRSMKARG